MGIITKIVKKYERHILGYNLLLGGIGVFIIYLIQRAEESISIITAAKNDTFFGTLAGIFVSIWGFSMAAVSILIAVIHGINDRNEKIQLIRESKWYSQIYDLYLHAMLFSGFSAILSILSMKSNFILIRILLVYFSLLTLIYLFLSIWTLKKVIRTLTS